MMPIARLQNVMVVCAAVAVGAVCSWAFPPEPAPVPTSWELDVDFGELYATTLEVVEQDEQGEERVKPISVVYTTYTVTNHTGQDLLFAPRFELGTDKGPPLRSGVRREATVELLERLQNPFLEDQISILGTLQQGEENAKDGLVIWKLDDLSVDELAVYAEGFSGETTALERTDPATGEVIRVVLRKTYVQRFATPGTIDPGKSEPFRRIGRTRAVMR